MAQARTLEEVEAAYRTQLQALKASCDNYDAGQHWEAMRMATSIYVLVNDGGRKNQSLLTQLGLKRKLLFVASGREIDGKNLLQDEPLVRLRISTDGTHYMPLLGEGPFAPRRLRFSHWWERDPVIRSEILSISRKNLVFSLRNKEGGSHFDQLDDAAYIRFATNPAWTHEGPKGAGPVEGVVRTTMRQVVWELFETIRDV